MVLAEPLSPVAYLGETTVHGGLASDVTSAVEDLIADRNGAPLHSP